MIDKKNTKQEIKMNLEEHIIKTIKRTEIKNGDRVYIFVQKEKKFFRINKGFHPFELLGFAERLKADMLETIKKDICENIEVVKICLDDSKDDNERKD